MTEQLPSFPGFDVLERRDTLSWNDVTRQTIEHRLDVPLNPRFFNMAEWDTLRAVCARIMPQPDTRPQVPLPAYVDLRLVEGRRDGYREPGMPGERQAWRTGLAALEVDAGERFARGFTALDAAEQDGLLEAMQKGELDGPHWQGMPSKTFFKRRVIPDITHAYYAHPTAWNEIGWPGPASPRGYVRLEMNRRDPWEAAEAKPGHEGEALRANKHVV